MTEDENLTYETALAELHQIQASLENNDVSIDELTVKVKRAHFLVGVCEAKLRDTEADVRKIWAESKKDQ